MKERLVGFLEKFIFGKYKNHLIKNAIINSGNKYLFSIPYTPHTNGAIDAYFNQIKHYLKLNKKFLKYNELKLEIKKAIQKVKKHNYKNYFLYAYKKQDLRKYKKECFYIKMTIKEL